MDQFLQANSSVQEQAQDCEIASAEECVRVVGAHDCLLLLKRERVEFGPDELGPLDILEAVSLSPTFFRQPAGERLETAERRSKRVLGEGLLFEIAKVAVAG